MDKAKLQQELIAAMKAQDEVKKSTIRMLISAINYYEIEKGGAGYVANRRTDYLRRSDHGKYRTGNRTGRHQGRQ